MSFHSQAGHIVNRKVQVMLLNRILSSLKSLDIVLLISVIGLIMLGILFIYSSGISSSGEQISREWMRQILWSGTGLFLMLLGAAIDYRRYRPFVLPAYGLILLFLILVLIIGTYSKGARAWFGLGGLGIQPSEFTKLAVILMLAWWFDEHGNSLSDWKLWVGSIVITLVPVLLILLQPDLGTAIVFIPILITVAFCTNIAATYIIFPLLSVTLIIITVLGYVWSQHIAENHLSAFRLFSDSALVKIISPSLIVFGILMLLGWLIYRRWLFIGILYVFGILTTFYAGSVGVILALKNYQIMRLAVFLDPQIDPKGAGWQIIQSVTAVGSGGWFGKGFLKGTQSHYRYLPEQSTDFIFSILAEEMGFAGAILVFILFSTIIIRSLYIAYRSQDYFGTYIAIGIASMIAYHVIQNIGMAIGFMPITGIPLFFLSYGGSSLWTVLLSIGILSSINARRLGI